MLKLNPQSVHLLNFQGFTIGLSAGNSKSELEDEPSKLTSSI